MCHGPYAPPILLLPLYVIFGIKDGIVHGSSFIDNRVRENNLAIVQFFEKSSKKLKEDLSVSHQLDAKTTVSITSVKARSVELNEEEKEELAHLLMQRSVARMEQGKFAEAKDDLLEVFELIDPSKHSHIMHFMMGCAEYSLGEFQESANSFTRAIVAREALSSLGLV